MCPLGANTRSCSDNISLAQPTEICSLRANTSSCSAWHSKMKFALSLQINAHAKIALAWHIRLKFAVLHAALFNVLGDELETRGGLTPSLP